MYIKKKKKQNPLVWNHFRLIETLKVGYSAPVYSSSASPNLSILHNPGTMIRTRKTALVQYYSLKHNLMWIFLVFPLLFFLCSRMPQYIELSSPCGLLQSVTIPQSLSFWPWHLSFRKVLGRAGYARLTYHLLPQTWGQCPVRNPGSSRQCCSLLVASVSGIFHLGHL